MISVGMEYEWNMYAILVRVVRLLSSGVIKNHQNDRGKTLAHKLGPKMVVRWTVDSTLISRMEKNRTLVLICYTVIPNMRTPCLKQKMPTSEVRSHVYI